MGVHVNITGPNGLEYQHKTSSPPHGCKLDAWWELIDEATLKNDPAYEHDDEGMSWNYPLDAATMERHAERARALHREGHPGWPEDDDPIQHAIDVAKESERQGQHASFWMDF